MEDGESQPGLISILWRPSCSVEGGGRRDRVIVWSRHLHSVRLTDWDLRYSQTLWHCQCYTLTLLCQCEIMTLLNIHRPTSFIFSSAKLKDLFNNVTREGGLNKTHKTLSATIYLNICDQSIYIPICEMLGLNGKVLSLIFLSWAKRSSNASLPFQECFFEISQLKEFLQKSPWVLFCFHLLS